MKWCYTFTVMFSSSSAVMFCSVNWFLCEHTRNLFIFILIWQRNKHFGYEIICPIFLVFIFEETSFRYLNVFKWQFSTLFWTYLLNFVSLSIFCEDFPPQRSNDGLCSHEEWMCNWKAGKKRENIWYIIYQTFVRSLSLRNTNTHTHTSTLAQQSINPSLFNNSILFPFEYNSSCVFPFHCFGFVFGNFGRDHDFCVQSHLHRNWHAILFRWIFYNK